ncbi:MAG: hypothetical protein U1E69_19835 [Tabrizicola sp.]|uniref:hypothetical protein n=1 Tax=Tabrizicola sp. TaxID=2005166 RepID=UPI002AB926C7|nr:hypothetical protein [Tabrizicola sp.]MDZ4089050.1 hypothetical protein [Tabrizicola sp.]
MKVVAGYRTALVLFLAVLALSSCTSETSWNQRLTLVIETPQGEVRGSAVTRVTKTETSGSLVLPEARGVRSKVEGEAVVVEVAPGKFLFALLSGSGEEKRDATHWVYPAYRLSEADSYGGEMMKLLSQPYDAPVPLPPEGWPMLVTFDDISKPETVRRVNPEDLVAVFGEGVRLKAVTLEITEEAVTVERVEGVLTWLGVYPEPGLCPATGGPLADAPFCRLVKMGDLIRRP